MAGWLQKRLHRMQQTGGELLRISRNNPEMGRLLTRQIPSWDKAIGKDLRVQIISDLSAHVPDIGQYVAETLLERFEMLGNLERWRVWRLFVRQVRQPHMTQLLTSIWDVLPSLVERWDDPRIEDWFQEALQQTNHERALAFVLQESEHSQQRIAEENSVTQLIDLIGPLTRYAQAHAGDWRDLIQLSAGPKAYSDGAMIYLPPQMAGDYQTARDAYRLEVAILAAFFEFGTFDFDPEPVLKRAVEPRPDELPLEWFLRSFPSATLAQEIFFLLEDVRLSALICETYPGLSKSVMQRRLSKWRHKVNAPITNEVDRCLVDLGACYVEIKDTADTHQIVQQFFAQEDSPHITVEHTIIRLHQLFDSLYGLMTNRRIQTVSEPPVEMTRMSRKNRQHQVKATQYAKKSSLSLVRSLHETKADFETDWQSVSAGTHGTLLEDRQEQPPQVRGDLVDGQQELLSGQYRYPEWDMTIADFRPNWTNVIECTMAINEKGMRFAEETSLTYSTEMKRIRALFQMIVTGQRTRQRGVSDGDVLEFDQWISSRIQRKLKQQPSDRLYARTTFNHRDPAVAFLVDLSSSTNEITSQAKPILDIEKSALLLMSEALHALGDPFAIFGWSGFGREQVVFYTAKAFDEPWSDATRSKVGGLSWKLENRDGAAIRHATSIMSSWKHDQKILFILSDGKPLDCGCSRYFDDYAQADTKQALQAARAVGITPFCVTIDPYGQDYLEQMYGRNRFMTIEDLHLFPEKLARLYTSLTTR